jgi:peptidoglycan/xylan/chitin deacetylase (PgdA/CDA1 family)/archaellum component FlaC
MKKYMKYISVGLLILLVLSVIIKNPKNVHKSQFRDAPKDDFGYDIITNKINLVDSPIPRVEKSTSSEIGDSNSKINELWNRYKEYYSALKYYSNIADDLDQNTPEYIIVSAAGKYIREKLDEIEDEIKTIKKNTLIKSKSNKDFGFLDEQGEEGGNDVFIPNISVLGKISSNVQSELNTVFGVGWDEGLSELFQGRNGKESKSLGNLNNGNGKVTLIKKGYCGISYAGKKNTPVLVQYDGFLKKGEIIITLDDGPVPETRKPSTFMRDHNVKAVFFVLGYRLDKTGKSVIEYSFNEGHQIGVHGYYHATEDGKPFTAVSLQDTLKQIAKVKKLIIDATGKEPEFFRPPYGIISPEALKSIISEDKLIPVGWTIDTKDWAIRDPNILYDNTIQLIKKRGKGILLMHDIHKHSRTTLENLIKWLHQNNYKIVSPEILKQDF